MFRVGDLVRHVNDPEIGIVLSQVGCVDRWLVYWFTNGYKQGYNGYILEVVE